MTLLVRTPSPRPTESLLGYVLRVSEQNGYDTPWHVLSHAGIVQGQMRTAGFPVEKLAAILGVTGDALERIAYQEFSGTERYFKILAHRLGKTLGRNPLRLDHPAFCPACVGEHGYIDAFWDLTSSVSCPHHGTTLLRNCPLCDTPISWFRPGLLKCKCGADFTGIETRPADAELGTLMALFQAMLHKVPTAGITNPFGFPLQTLEKIPLGPLMQIVHNLGKWNRISHGLEAVDDSERVFADAIEPLKDWPEGFHKMLRRLGEKSVNNGGGGAGFRKQFNSFVGSVIENKYCAKFTEFLSEEFLTFGKVHWGHALVDGKLFAGRKKQEQTAARYISKTEFAKRYGLWKPTMDRLIRTGVISTKRIKTGKTGRVLVDLEKSRLPVDSQGIVTVREAARQAGLPVSVLKWTRRVGLYIEKVRGGFESSWHQEDVNEFVDRGLALAPIVSLTSEGVTVGEAMRLKFRNTDAKADVIGAIFDGRLNVIGRIGDNFEGLLLGTKELDEFARQKRIGSFGGTYSFNDVAKESGLDSMVVSDAAAKGLLEIEIIDRHQRLTKRSLDSFLARYVLLGSLAAELGTSVPALHRCCRKNAIPVTCLNKKNTGVQQPIVLRTDEIRLRTLWAAQFAQRAVVKYPRNQGEVFLTGLLRKYLGSLAQRGEKLPRLASKPNRVLIAAGAGFGRNAFYAYGSLVEMLDQYDATERLHDDHIPLAPLVAIGRYLSRLRDEEQALPVRRCGKPNIVAISKACGCSRQIFDNKGNARRLLNEFIAASKLPAAKIA